MSVVMGMAAEAEVRGQSAQSVDQTLRASGYTAVPLQPSAAGHLHAAGLLNGVAVEVLIDTGASNTVIDVELARQLGLTLTPAEERGAGVGESSVAVNRVTNACLNVGGIPVDGDVYTMDLSAIRAALAARGVAAFQAVLGGDTMRRLDAVLLYRENMLFLRGEEH